MVDDRINAKSCYLEYGNPSGHSVMAATFPTYILLMHYHTERRQNIPLKDKVFQWRYILGLIGILTLELLMSFDRLILGLHTID